VRIPQQPPQPLATDLPRIEQQVTRLIEQLAGVPLLFDKLRLTDAPWIDLKINAGSAKSSLKNGSPALTQLQLPRATFRFLGVFNQSAASEVRLSYSPSARLIELAMGAVGGLATKANDEVNSPVARLYFAQAQLLNGSMLRLSSPSATNRSGSVAQSAGSQQNAALGSQQNLSTLSGSEVNTRQLVAEFLKASSPDLAPLSNYLNKLLQNFSALQRSLDGLPPVSTNKGDTNRSGADKRQASGLLGELSRLSSLQDTLKTGQLKADSLKAVANLQNLIARINQSLDFSRNNKQLNLNARIFQSGNFFEASQSPTQTPVSSLPGAAPARLTEALRQESLPPSQVSANKIGQLNSDNYLSGSQQSPQSNDLKSLLLQLKQTLVILFRETGQNPERPMLASRWIETLLPALPGAADQQIKSTPASESLIATLKQDVSGSAQLVEKLINYLASSATRRPTYSLQQLQNLAASQRLLITEMLTDVTNALSKIESNQLLSLRSEPAQLQQFLIDLPIYNQGKLDSFELLMESNEQSSDRQSGRTWTVTIRFDLEPLGPMFARISLKNQRIATRFFAKDELTAKLLDENIEHLKKSLFAAGVEIDEISGQQGLVPETLLSNDTHRVDVKA